MLARIRKAVIAGLGAGLAAAVAVAAKAGTLDRATVSQMIGAFVVAAAITGLATWRVPNAQEVTPAR